MHKKLLQKQEGLAIIIFTGVWRSLVARTAGGREVAGSNPVAPIKRQLLIVVNCLFFLEVSETFSAAAKQAEK